MLVEPAEELFLCAKRRKGFDGLHASPWRAVAISPPKIIIEVKAALFAGAIEESACDMDYLWMGHRLKNLVRSVDRRIVIAKEILLRHVRNHVVDVVGEGQLNILVLKLNIHDALVLAAVDVAYLLDVTDNTLLAVVLAPLREIEVDHLRNAGAVMPRVIALMTLLGPVHREWSAFEVKVGETFERARNKSVGSDVYYALDIGVLEVAVEEQFEVGDVAAAVGMDSKRDELLFEASGVHDCEAIVDLRMALLERIELSARGVAQVQREVVDVIENVFTCVFQQRRHRNANHERKVVVALKQYVNSFFRIHPSHVLNFI